MHQERGPRIGLALSSGGARGFAHVGVIKGLIDAGYSISAIAGSSMGSIIAAGFAAQGSVSELEAWALAFRARDHSRSLLPIMDPTRLMPFLDDLLNGVTFAECVLPLKIVATDLRERAAITLGEGSVALAAFASSAMPFFHRPVPWRERLLADGSLSCVLPLEQAATANEVDLVIGSLVSRQYPLLNTAVQQVAQFTGGVVHGWPRPYFDFFRDRTPQAAWVANDTVIAVPNLVITPTLPLIGQLDFGRVRAAITAGEEAVASRLEEIRALLDTKRPTPDQPIQPQ